VTATERSDGLREPCAGCGNADALFRDAEAARDISGDHELGLFASRRIPEGSAVRCRGSSRPALQVDEAASRSLLIAREGVRSTTTPRHEWMPMPPAWSVTSPRARFACVPPGDIGRVNERRPSMYIGIGTILVILVIILLVFFLRGRSV
jgi:hypothetical protein